MKIKCALCSKQFEYTAFCGTCDAPKICQICESKIIDQQRLVEEMKKNPKPNFLQYTLLAMEMECPPKTFKEIRETMETCYLLNPISLVYEPDQKKKPKKEKESKKE